MDTTAGYLAGNPNDFKVCTRCGHINWYENDQCVMCHCTEFEEYTDIVEWKIDQYLNHREVHDRHFCDECMVTV